VQSLFQLFDEVLDEEPAAASEGSQDHYVRRGGSAARAVAEKFALARELTAGNSGLMLNLCVMYSGRSEIAHAARTIALAAQRGQVDPDEINEQSFGRFLLHPELPDLDLVIRTSGEQRVSNFLLWQMAYAELVFSEVLWPDYTRADFLAALLSYQERHRRFGKV